MRYEIFLIPHVVFLISLFFILSGCASAVNVSKPTVLSVAEHAVCEDSSVIASIQKRSEYLKTLKGTARIEINLKDGKEMSGRAVVIIQRPNRLRLEILGPLNQTVAVLLYDGIHFSLLSFQERRLYKDYPFPVDVARLPHYLLGLPSGEVASQESRAAHESLAREVRSQDEPFDASCHYINLEGEQIWINPEGRIEKILFPTSGINETYNGQYMQASMNSYKEVNGFMFPLSISLGNKVSSVSLRYEQIELNQQILEDSFNLPHLQGIEEIFMFPEDRM